MKSLFVILLSYLLFFSSALFAGPANHMSAKSLPTVAVITTGGTIAEGSKNGAVVPSFSGKTLIRAIPKLKQLAHVKVISFSNVDSSYMTPAIWSRLSRLINKVAADPKVKGVIVTHGTDTMAEGAFFIDLTVKNHKPIVFTGSMRDAKSISADGPMNIYNSVIEVLSPDAHLWGVTVNINNNISSAWSVRKTQTTNLQAFSSGEQGYVGYIAGEKVVRLNHCISRKKLMFTLPKVLPNVPLITMYSGYDGKTIRDAVKEGAKGIVVEAFGAGNVNESTYWAIVDAIKQHVVIVITSRVPLGGVFPLYGVPGGGASLQKAGAILSQYLKGPKARLLLMLAIAKDGRNTKIIRHYFSS